MAKVPSFSFHWKYFCYNKVILSPQKETEDFYFATLRAGLLGSLLNGLCKLSALPMLF